MLALTSNSFLRFGKWGVRRAGLSYLGCDPLAGGDVSTRRMILFMINLRLISEGKRVQRHLDNDLPAETLAGLETFDPRFAEVSASF